MSQDANMPLIWIHNQGTRVPPWVSQLPYDLLLIDAEMLSLPVAGVIVVDCRGVGLATLKYVCERCSVPVVALTDHEDVDDAASLNVAEVLTEADLTLPIVQRVLRYAVRTYQLDQTIDHMQYRTVDAEMRFQTLIERNPDGIVMVDNEGMIVYANPAALDLFNRPLEALVGKPLGSPMLSDDMAEIEIVRADGQMTLVEMRMNTTQWHDHPASLLRLRDITARRRAERELQALYNATSYLLQASSLDMLAQQIVGAVVREFAYVDCGLILVDRQDSGLLRLARAGDYHARPERALTVNGPGLVPLAVRTAQIVYAGDVSLHPHYLSSDSRTQSELVIPLIGRKGILGVLDLQCAEKNGFDERDQRILTTYAERAAAAIETMLLYEQINEHAAELEQRVRERTAELQQAKDEGEAVLNNSADGILLIDMRLRIRRANTRAYGLFATSAEDFSDAPLLGFIAPEDMSRMMQALHAIIHQDEPKRLLEVRCCRLDRSIFEAEISLGYLRDEGIVCNVRDITERKVRERQLLYYAALQESVTDAVISTDLDFQIQSWNKAAEAIYGWREKDVLGRSLLDLLPDLAHTEEERFQDQKNLFKRGSWAGEVRHQARDGDEVYILSTITLLKDTVNQPIGLVAVNRDISAHKKVQADLEESRRFTQKIAAAAPCIIHVFDLMIHRHVYVNHTLSFALGYTLRDTTNLEGAMKMHPDDREAFRRHIERVRQSPDHITHELEFRMQDVDGHWRWFLSQDTPFRRDPQGYITQILGVATDITARKKAEEAMQETEQRFRLIVNSVQDYAIFMLDPQGTILSWNPGAEYIKGYTAQEIIGQNFSIFYLPSDQAQGQPQAILANARIHGHTATEGWRVRKNGERFWASVTITALHDQDNALIGYTKITRDLSERKAAEEALKQAFAQEKELGELKSRFVSMASHEFRTPLATILAMTEMLSHYRHRLTDEQIDLRLHRIQEQIDYLTQIMDDMLNLARLQARRAEFNPVELDLNALCLVVMDEFAGRPGFGHRFDYRCDPSLHSVRLDRKLIRQIIGNLISNSVKYSIAQSTITIEVSRDESNVIFRIGDSGIGIPEPDMKRLFEPFHRAENVGTIPGTGLGLTIIKESVELHGGTIDIESRLGVGTTIIITIPLSASEGKG